LLSPAAALLDVVVFIADAPFALAPVAVAGLKVCTSAPEADTEWEGLSREKGSAGPVQNGGKRETKSAYKNKAC